MARLSFDEWCDAIESQTSLLREAAVGGDLDASVPSCPGWSVRQLLQHIGNGHRWAATTVRTRAAAPPPDDNMRQLTGHGIWDDVGLDAWLTAGATELAGALRAAGPDAEMWTPVPGGTAAFFARRFAHETAIHRADACAPLHAPIVLADALARDTMDEWMELGSLPIMFEYFPEKRALLGPGRTIQLHATDTSATDGADWLVDLTGDALAWRQATEPAAVTVSEPLTDLVLLVYRRIAPDASSVTVTGDRGLLDFWLERVGFG